jgi:pimeloyl-ACP methyl ester carboxylesterase
VAGPAWTARACAVADCGGMDAGLRVPVTLARGEYDAISTSEQFARLGVPTVTLPGLGHNAHVENPDLPATLLDSCR